VRELTCLRQLQSKDLALFINLPIKLAILRMEATF
jgi:hypothetical protein